MIPQRNISLIANDLAADGGRRIPEAVIERDYVPCVVLERSRIACGNHALHNK